MGLPERFTLNESLSSPASQSSPCLGTCHLSDVSAPYQYWSQRRQEKHANYPMGLPVCGPEPLGPEADRQWVEEGLEGEAVGRV